MEPEGTARETWPEEAEVRDLDAVYRRRHRRLEGAGRFVRLVEEGGMGAVLEVRAAGGQPLALKLIKESLTDDARAAARFRRELASHRRLSASFQVPRLVPCLKLADHDQPGRVFGLFPFYADGSLEDGLRRGLSRREALWILADAVEGLQSLHGLQYVHRDFHPMNVLVEREGGRRRGVLGDLGVGIFLRSNTIFSESQLEDDRPRRVGHPGYIDPSYRASPEADMYAVGATLYRILAGRSPAAKRRAKPGPLGLPQGLDLPGRADVRRVAERMLDRLTTPDDGGRYPSLREAREDLVRLAELLEDVSVPARTVPLRVVGRGWKVGRWVGLAALLLAVAPHPRPLSHAPLPPSRERGATSLSQNPPAARENPPSRPPKNPPSIPPFSKGGSGATARPAPPPSAAHASVSHEMEVGEQGGGGGAPGRGLPLGGRRRPSPGRAEVEGGRGDGGEGLRAEEGTVASIDALIQERRYPRAEELSRTLWQEHPGDPEVAGRLALLVTRNRPESGWSEARAVLTLALLRHAERGDLRLALARVSMAQDLMGSALRCLREAPAASSHRDEIEALRVTLERAGDR